MDPFGDDVEDLIHALPENVREGVPKIQLIHQGKTSVITNFLAITKGLQRDPNHLKKFISTALGIQTKIKDRQLILKSTITIQHLEDTLEKYVELFVICPNCGKPDTLFEFIRKKNHIKCLACGFEHHWK